MTDYCDLPHQAMGDAEEDLKDMLKMSLRQKGDLQLSGKAEKDNVKKPLSTS